MSSTRADPSRRSRPAAAATWLGYALALLALGIAAFVMAASGRDGLAARAATTIPSIGAWAALALGAAAMQRFPPVRGHGALPFATAAIAGGALCMVLSYAVASGGPEIGLRVAATVLLAVAAVIGTASLIALVFRRREARPGR